MVRIEIHFSCGSWAGTATIFTSVLNGQIIGVLSTSEGGQEELMRRLENRARVQRCHAMGTYANSAFR